MALQNLKNNVACAIFENRNAVVEWFEKKFTEFPPAFYCSVDIRDSGQKVVPVDCNLYPAGFNNICEVDRDASPPLFRAQIEKLAGLTGYPVPEKILIIPESHSENKFYLENLYFLRTILEDAGFEVELGRYGDEKKDYELITASEKRITEYFLTKENGMLKTSNGFVPDWIVLNNDFSQGYPDCLDNVKQPIFPTYKLGWHTRKKSTHFNFYNQLAAEFAGVIGLDPWHISIESKAVQHVDFGTGAGIDRVMEASKTMLANMQEEYTKRGITRKPALFVKNDSGTYGIGIMVIESVEELEHMNRRTKNKMSVGKNKSHIEQVIVQEGVPTTLSVNGNTSEPVVYIMGQELIGGFIRANTERGDIDNLNSQGMYFKKLCFKDLSDSLLGGSEDEVPQLEAIYGVVAKLSALAAAMEVKQAYQ